MECFSLQFCEVVRRALEGRQPLLGTIAERAGGFAQEIRSRQDITLMTVTAANRDELPSEVAMRLQAYARKAKRAEHENSR